MQLHPSSIPDIEQDHRVRAARARRENMRKRILEATMRVFSKAGDDAPVIEDVVKEADIARGTFYKHFDSLEQALMAAGTEANDRMIEEIVSVYHFLKEPWQRSSVGFRVYMVRAHQDPTWAAFVARMDAWSRISIITRHMAEDFRRGCELGQFHLDDIDAAVDFFKGASLGGVYAMKLGVPDPPAYMDAAVHMAMSALGCDAALRQQAVEFSRSHVSDWDADRVDKWSAI